MVANPWNDSSPSNVPVGRNQVVRFCAAPTPGTLTTLAKAGRKDARPCNADRMGPPR